MFVHEKDFFILTNITKNQYKFTKLQKILLKISSPTQLNKIRLMSVYYSWEEREILKKEIIRYIAVLTLWIILK